jgi:hypothetical protein
MYYKPVKVSERLPKALTEHSWRSARVPTLYKGESNGGAYYSFKEEKWKVAWNTDIDVDAWLEPIIECIETPTKFLLNKGIAGTYVVYTQKDFRTRDNPIKVIDLLTEYNLPREWIKEIDFGGQFKCRLEYDGNQLTCTGAMDGFGNGINLRTISIETKQKDLLPPPIK